MTDQQQQVAGNPLDQLREAHVVFLDVLRNVRPEQMSLPTPDDEWDVRALINHVVLGNTWAAENVKTGSAPRPSGDIIGEHEPVEVYTASADAMMASFEEPGALSRMVKMPFGEMPAAGLAAFRFVDLIVHAWDLAKATGRTPTSLPTSAKRHSPCPGSGWPAWTAPTCHSKTRCPFPPMLQPQIDWRDFSVGRCRARGCHFGQEEWLRSGVKG